MQRREWLATALSLTGGGLLGRSRGGSPQGTLAMGPLKPPSTGKIDVAFLIGNHANVIDTAGPWEVFQDVVVPGRGEGEEDERVFRLFTVAERTTPVRMTGGLCVTPDFALADAPRPRVIIIPAMDDTPSTVAWVKAASAAADLTMSVCTGAFQLAQAGLLDGLAATTHHGFHDEFERSFPKVKLQRGPRFVESSERIATAGGLTSGIDLALRVVDRYFGRGVAQATARYLEYTGTSWQV